MSNRFVTLKPWLTPLEHRRAPAAFIVTSLTDTGTGSGNSGDLRYCLTQANLDATPDTITFDAAVTGTIQLTSALSITQPVTITGPGAANLTIKGTNSSRHFTINVGGGAGKAVAISGLTLANGKVGARGGSVSLLDDSLTLDGVVFLNNTSSTGGGAVTVETAGATLVVKNSRFDGNTTAGSSTLAGGGVVLNNATGVVNLVVENSTFTGNKGTGNSARGGAVYSRSSANKLTITGSTFSNNSANNAAGAIFAPGGIFNLVNSTISGNNATDGYGGGIGWLGNATSTFTVTNSTIVNNTAGDSVFGGGGVFLNSADTTYTFTNTIVAQNIGPIAPDVRLAGVIFGDANFIGVTGADTVSGGAAFAGSDNQLGTLAEPLDPLLEPLGNYGGPTLTHALKATSPALNKGAAVADLTTDQRGFARVLDGVTDIGAVEGTLPAPTAALAKAPPITAPGDTTYSFDILYADDAGIDAATLGLGDVEITGKGFATPQSPTAFSVSGSGKFVTVTYTIPAPGGAFAEANVGPYTASVRAGEVLDSTGIAVKAGPVGVFHNGIPTTFIVDELSDIVDGNYSPGKLSLREAISLANDFVSPDTITFSQAVFASPSTLKLTAGQFVITQPVTVTGPAARLTLDAQQLGRHLKVDTVLSSQSVTVTDLTFTNGKTVNQRGGSIWLSDDTLTLERVTVTKNLVSGASAGGINVEDTATLVIRDSVLTDNVTRDGGSGGGAIGVQGIFPGTVVTIERSVITGNKARSWGAGVMMYNLGTLNVTDSTLSNNFADARGGAIFSWRAAVNLSGSTLTNNEANEGGAINFYKGGPGLNAVNTTIANNTAEYAGGVHAAGEVEAINLDSTAVAGNTAFQFADIQFAGAVNANFSLIGVADAGGFDLVGIENKTGTQAAPLLPMLSELRNYGGAVPVHLPLPGSPLIDAGANFLGLEFDQRGKGFPRVVGTAADIGSTEGAWTGPDATLTNAPRVTAAGATNYSFQITYTDDVGINIGSIGLSDVVVSGKGFTAPQSPTTFAASGSGKTVTVTYTIPAPGGAFDLADNGDYAVTLRPGEVTDTDGQVAGGGDLGTARVAIPVVIVVDELTDVSDGQFGPGQLSLREALELANADQAPTEVRFAAGLFPSAKSITLTKTLTITDPDGLTLTGPGADKLTISGNKQVRVFSIDDGSFATVPEVTLRNFAVTGGNWAGSGAGVYAADDVTLDGLHIHGNSGGSGAGVGGNYAPLKIFNSTIANNTASLSGGGIELPTGDTRIRNSTISGNVAGKNGGAMNGYNTTLGSLLVENSTITGNSAGTGGGIKVRDDGFTVNLVSSIVANNTVGGSPSDLFGNIFTAQSSLIGAAGGSFTFVNLGGNETGTSGSPLNPQLEPLADNGGPTPTHALKANSPAIDAGLNPAGLTSDQRGGAYVRVFGAAADMGSFEVQPPPLGPAPTVANITIDDGTAQRSAVRWITVAFDTLVTLPTNAADAFQLARTGPGTPTGNVTLSVTLSGTTATVAKVTFAGSLTAGGSLIDGWYVLTVLANQVTANGQTLDGNGDGTAGDDATANLHRLFGDTDGNATIDFADFLAFRAAFGTSGGSVFDFDGDGNVNFTDFLAFRARFGTTLAP